MNKEKTSGYSATIGLEVHAELKTATKMFCNSKNDPEEREPNVNVCSVCLAHPGTLPVINKAAVHHVLLVGAAIGANIADFTEFDRKNYFYPDIPKGYQISQYKFPLVSGGQLSGVEVTRVHLEEDTARSIHTKDGSLVDFNRAGLPLMELVTEPVIRSAEQAGVFARELQLLLRTLGVADANMEKGEMRVEANISVSKDSTLGVKTEVKNLNSFKSVERAIRYEIDRQIKELDTGGEVFQETRGWDENKQATFSQRKKESSHDYRYFPDPDLPKLRLSELEELSLESLRAELPELPEARRTRYQSEFGLKEDTAAILTANFALGKIFDEVQAKSSDKSHLQNASNFLTADVVGIVNDSDLSYDDMKLQSEAFLKMVEMYLGGDISSRGAKDILKILVLEGGDPENLIDELGLRQTNDPEAMEKLAKTVIAMHPEAVESYRAGKEASLKFLVGQGMKESKGSANPGVLIEILETLLKS